MAALDSATDSGSHSAGPLMVSGGTGYLAGWVIADLLERGLTVHGTVRDLTDQSKFRHLLDIASDTTGNLVLHEADLLDGPALTRAAEGCRTIIHTASPFLIAPEASDPHATFVRPAVTGTRNVLTAAADVGTVDRVVLTSSCAAIWGGQEDLRRAPHGVLTEDLWNTESSLERNPYSYSKTAAEREAWSIAQEQDRWSLVVLNPAFIVGPGLGERHSSGSFDFLRLITEVGDRPAPPFEMGMVDVRDVALAHVQAATLREVAGRHIVFSEVLSLGDVADILRQEFPQDAPFASASELPEVNLRWRADNSKSRTVLGISYRPVRQGIVEMYAQLAREKSSTGRFK